MIKITSLLVVLSAGILLSGCASVLSPEKKYDAVVRYAPFDAVIVPGFPHEKGNWSMVVKCRVYWAVYLYNKGVVKNIIFSGSSVYTPYVEGEIMALYAEQMGVPKEHIFVETRAEHSSENLYYSYLLAKEHNFKSVAVASDAVQCIFLKRFQHPFKLNDLKFIPIVYDDLQLKEHPDPVINEEEAYVADFVSLKQRENFLQRYRATHGCKVRKLIRENNECAQDSPSEMDKVSLEQSLQNHH
ncbi:MAG: YdcF family protein [Cytophagaceae bacterium]|nr:YdcF family protein [Cytophagaceae bacterium]